jgi:hypothetical protein
MEYNLVDGIPVFETIEEAVAEAKKIGCKGYHGHQLEGREVYMPCADHDEVLDIIDTKGQDIEDVLEDNIIIGVREITDPESVSKRYMDRLAKSELNGEKFYRIVSNPNEPSVLDLPYKRYRYIYAPGEGAPDLIDTSRGFCKRMMGGVQKVYRYEDIMDLSAQLEVEDTSRRIIPRPKDSGPVNIWVWKGGAGCQHRFIELVLEPKGFIPNNAQAAQRVAQMELPADGQSGQINLPPNYASGFAKEKQEFDYNVSSLSPYATTTGGTEIEEGFIDKKPYEKKDAYLQRCMSALTGEFPDEKQRYAVCNSDWESFNSMELDVYGYPTEYFYICPGAKATFMELMSVDNDEDTIGMIRSAAIIADKVFDIEEDVIEEQKASPKDLELAKLLVDDYKDLIQEIAKIQGKDYNVDYMDGHIDTISKFVVSEMFRKNLDRGIVVDIEGALIKDGKPVMKTIEYLEDMSDRYKIILISGRPESKLDETIAELENYGIEYDELYLQDLSEDTTGDVAMRFKTNKVKKLMQSGFNISEMISADSGTLAALEQLGIGLYYPEELDVLFRPTAFAKGKALFETQEEALEYAMFCGCGGYVSDYMFKGQKLFMSCAENREPQAFSMEEERRIIYAPVMVPGKIIPRLDEFGQKYFVTFTPETIEKMAYKYMKEKRTDKVNYEHSDEKLSDVYMVESWVINSENDKAYNFFQQEDIPIGTWMAAFKVDSDEVWNNYVKANKVKGVSLQGNFLYTN